MAAEPSMGARSSPALYVHRSFKSPGGSGGFASPRNCPPPWKAGQSPINAESSPAGCVAGAAATARGAAGRRRARIAVTASADPAMTRAPARQPPKHVFILSTMSLETRGARLCFPRRAFASIVARAAPLLPAQVQADQLAVPLRIHLPLVDDRARPDLSAASGLKQLH